MWNPSPTPAVYYEKYIIKKFPDCSWLMAKPIHCSMLCAEQAPCNLTLHS